jgi:sugar lactone lactonase YvrE
MAILDLPSSVVVDAVGNILISDQANFRIRLLEPNGTINTIVGIGTPGYAGDGGPAAEAQLNSPKGQAAAPAGRIDLDANDRIIIADTANHVIRLVDNDGTIRTIAGNNTAGYSGDGGPATSAQLNTPSDVAVGPDGSIYVADTMNHAVRKIDPAGIITTFAGTGVRGFGGDGGPPEEAQLDRPYGVFAAANGDVYIADTHNQRVRLVVQDGTGVEPPDPPDEPDIEIIPCTDEVGSICTFAGTGVFGFDGDGKDRLQTAIYWPFDMEFTPSGRIYVLDWNNHKVRELLPDQTFVTVMGGDFVGDGPADLSDLTAPGAPGTSVQLNHPTDLIELPDGDLAVIAWHNHKIRILDPETGLVIVAMGRNADFMGDGAAAKDGRVNQPARAVLDSAGNLLLVDQRNQRIRMIDGFATARGDGVIHTILGSGMRGFNGDNLPLLETQVNWPTGGNPEPTGGIAMAEDGTVYFADTNNHRIRRVRFQEGYAAGEVITIAGTGVAGFSGDGGAAVEAQINYPQDLELGPDGNLYFADTNNNRVRRIDLTALTIETVAGNGEKAYGHDGEQAVEAHLNRPFGIAFDPAGDLYISDTFNGRIRKVKMQ